MGITKSTRAKPLLPLRLFLCCWDLIHQNFDPLITKYKMLENILSSENLRQAFQNDFRWYSLSLSVVYIFLCLSQTHSHQDVNIRLIFILTSNSLYLHFIFTLYIYTLYLQLTVSKVNLQTFTEKPFKLYLLLELYYQRETRSWSFSYPYRLNLIKTSSLQLTTSTL